MDDARKAHLIALAKRYRWQLLAGVVGLTTLASWNLIFGADDGPHADHRVVAAMSSPSPTDNVPKVKEGWSCSAIKRVDSNLLDASGLPLASWVSTADAQRVTDHLPYMQAAHLPYAPAGTLCRGWVEIKDDNPVVLYAQLAPAPNGVALTRQGRRSEVCATRVGVDRKDAIATTLTVPLNSRDPLLVASKPIRMPGRHLIEQWTNCEVGTLDDEHKALKVVDDRDQYFGAVQRFGNQVPEIPPASTLGVESSLWIGPANSSSRSLVRALAVTHDIDGEPHTAPGIVVLPSVGSGALEAHKQLGFRVDLMGYNDDFTRDQPNQPPVKSFYNGETQPGRFDVSAFGGPFVWEPHGAVWVTRDGTTQFALAVTSKTNRSLLSKHELLCYGHLEFDGKTIVDGPTTVDFGGSGWLDAGVKTTRGEHQLDGRLVCNANAFDGNAFNLDRNGFFLPGEGVTWQILTKPAGEDVFRPLARDEVYQR